MFADFQTAAKEEMFSPWCADPALAADLFREETRIEARACQGKKPHQGVAGEKSTLHQGIAWSKSTTALGFRVLTIENGVRSRCTGKERDTETGLDNFGKRYYGNALGRFMTPDPLLNSGQPWNPQSWNRYTYTLNNPLRYTDPTGLYTWGSCSGTADQCKADQQRFRDSISNLKKSAEGLKEGSKERKKLEGTIKKLGEEGKGNIKISFGDAGSGKDGPNLGRTLGNSITINYDAVDSVKTGFQLNQAESAALDAGVTGHEGTHAGGGPSVLGLLGMHGEQAAYTNESIVYQGLHNNDKPFQLWNESWSTLDEKTLDQTRDQAVQHFLHPDKVPAPIPHEKGKFPE